MGQMTAMVVALVLGVLPGTGSRVEYTASGGASFTFTFKVQDKTHVQVYANNVLQSAGVTVTTNANQDASPGGTVTFSNAPPVGQAVRIERTVPLTQGTVYTPYSAFPAKTTEKALDLSVMRDQQLDRRISDFVTSQDARDDAQESALAAGGVGGSDTYVTANGTPTARQQKEWFSDSIDVMACGADPTGATSSSATVQDCADRAKAAGKRLTARGGTYRFSTDVTLRTLAVDFSSATIIVDSGAKLIIGGTATLRSNPPQTFRSVTRDGGATATPTVRVMGAKMQRIEILDSDYVQLYADTSTGNSGPDYSIAYSEFHLLRVDKLELATNGSTPNSTQQWINENAFFMRRVTGSVIISGTYGHNHNFFYGGTFEGGASIDVQTGNSNWFWGVRFEGTAAPVSFGAGTWGNRVLVSWASNWNYDEYDSLVNATVTDLGEHNSVSPLARISQRRIPVVTVNADTCLVFTNTAGGSNFARGPNYTSIPGVDLQRYGPDTFHRQNFRLIYDSPLIPVAPGDSLVFSADQALFRPYVSFYDANRVKLTDIVLQTDVRGLNLTWDAGSSTVQSGANLSYIHVIAKASRVAFMKFDITGGSASNNVPFRRFGIHKITSAWTGEAEATAIRQTSVPPVVSASPTMGFAPVGYKISNVAGGWFTATRALDTTLSAPAASSAGTVTLTSVTGVANGDVIGIELDSGAWHWTTVNGAPAGNVVTLTVAMPSAAASGKRVVSNGWTGT